MKTFQFLPQAFGLVAAVQAWGPGWNETYTTVTVTTDIYTTYCPESTTFTLGTKTYTATASETITITDCPCTIKTSYPATGTPTGTIVPPPISPSGPSIVPPPVSHNSTSLPATVSKTISYLTTYCPSSSTIVIGSQSYTLSSGTQIVPIVSATVISPTKTPVGPATTATTGAAQFTGAAMRIEAGAGAIAAAGLVAFLL